MQKVIKYTLRKWILLWKWVTFDCLSPATNLFTLGAYFKIFLRDFKICFKIWRFVSWQKKTKKKTTIKKNSSSEISWFYNIYMNLLILVTFSFHLALCLNLWISTCSSILYDAVASSFSVVLSVSSILNNITRKKRTLVICSGVFNGFISLPNNIYLILCNF